MRERTDGFIEHDPSMALEGDQEYLGF
jgi:hypothetical protein